MVVATVSFLLICALALPVRAQKSIALDSLRWEHRVLLLPYPSSPNVDWTKRARDLRERDLLLFRPKGEVYRQVFPPMAHPAKLELPASMLAKAEGRVTLIGKDGGVKGQWKEESAALPEEVFRLIDGMPMRQREMREAKTAGDDLVGSPAKEWTAGPEWAHSKPLRLGDLRGRVVVVRFWTDTCPYCAKSLPAMQELADELEGQSVTFIGLYHSKPLGSERSWKEAVAHAEDLGVTFPLGYDHHWKTVRSWWLDGRRGGATSASFVIGPDGRIVHVHPGPVFFPSADPADARANAGFEAIRSAIRRHLPAAADE